ncbi:MAG: energy-coupling factor transporter transmembrane component T [Candidatus Bipolaricaulis sp.]|nr:energy-coupling factor transporter transmembrane component T [Candidatus Bipolaricaulis sp.]
MTRARGLHRAAPLAGFFLLLAWVGVVLAVPSLIVEGVVLAAVAGLAVVSGERPIQFLRRLRFIFLFALVLFVVQALSIHAGQVLVAAPIRITSGGLVAGGRMALRFLVILSASALFVQTTDADRLAQGLIRAGVPYRYGYLFILALRFVPFFQDELRSVREAQRVRGIDVSVRSPRRIAHAARYTFVPVLVSGLHRVDSIAISMKGRCFGLYSRRTTSREEPRSLWSVGALAVAGAAIALAIVAARGRWV